MLDKVETIDLVETVADQGVHSNLTFVSKAFEEQVRTDAILADLVQNLLLNLRLCAFDMNLASQVTMESEIHLELIKVFFIGSSDLQLNLEACCKLVLDML